MPLNNGSSSKASRLSSLRPCPAHAIGARCSQSNFPGAFSSTIEVQPKEMIGRSINGRSGAFGALYPGSSPEVAQPIGPHRPPKQETGIIFEAYGHPKRGSPAAEVNSICTSRANHAPVQVFPQEPRVFYFAAEVPGSNLSRHQVRNSSRNHPRPTSLRSFKREPTRHDCGSCP